MSALGIKQPEPSCANPVGTDYEGKDCLSLREGFALKHLNAPECCWSQLRTRCHMVAVQVCGAPLVQSGLSNAHEQRPESLVNLSSLRRLALTRVGSKIFRS